jgi:hypothetical protein
MKEIEVVVLETGPDYLDKIDNFRIEAPENRSQAVAKAIRTVEDRGYQVLPDDQGGNNEYIRVDSDKEYIAITIPCAEEEGRE